MLSNPGVYTFIRSTILVRALVSYLQRIITMIPTSKRTTGEWRSHAKLPHFTTAQINVLI